MSRTLAGLLASLGPDTGWNLVVWAGVGYGADIHAVRALGAARTLYLEPHPELHARLARRLQAHEQETLLPIALWNADGMVPFHRVSDPLQSSLLRPERLLRERPNLRIVSDEPVQANRVQDLCPGPDMAEGNNLLILDVCGAERDILDGAPENLLAGFSLVMVRSDRMHGPVGGDADVAGKLSALGFALDEGDLDGDGWRLFINEARMRRTTDSSGERCVEGLSMPPEEEHAEAAARAQTADTVREAEHDALIAERDEMMRQVEALRQQMAELQSADDSLETAKAAWVAERDALASEREKVARHEEALRQQVTNLQSSAEALEAANAALVAERDALARERDETEQQAQALRQQVDEGAQARGELEQQLAEARQTVALSVRLQSQHQADLRDLQERYRESQEIQERQRQLLARLSERLGVASHYFHRLADEREAQVASASIDDANSDHAAARQPEPVTADRKKRAAPARKPGRPAKTTGARSADKSPRRGRGSKSER